MKAKGQFNEDEEFAIVRNFITAEIEGWPSDRRAAFVDKLNALALALGKDHGTRVVTVVLEPRPDPVVQVANVTFVDEATKPLTRTVHQARRMAFERDAENARRAREESDRIRASTPARKTPVNPRRSFFSPKEDRTDDGTSTDDQS